MFSNTIEEEVNLKPLLKEAGGIKNMNSKVVLIRPPIVSKVGAINNEATPALALAYLSSYLYANGYESIMIDAIGEALNKTWPLTEYKGYQCHGLTFEEILEKIPNGTSVIGFSGMFSGEWPVVRSLIKTIRLKFPNAILVAGGEHVTSLTEYVLNDCPEMDFCVCGEGESIFYELVDSHFNNKDVYDVGGLAYIDNKGDFIKNGPLQRIRDIDSIPWPRWDDGYLEKFWEAGKSYGVSTGRDVPLMISRGCPYKCTFCSNEQMWTTRYILRDQDDVLDEVESYIKKYNPGSMQLYDLTAITKKKWIISFCNKVLERGIKVDWSLPSGTRSEVLDEETLSLLSKIGCKYMVYAPESGSERTREIIAKKVDINKLNKSVMAAKKYGMETRINLIIGFPGEKWIDVFKTLLYGLKMVIKGVDEAPIFLFSPYPGTKIFKELIENNELEINDDYFLNLTSLNSSYLSTKVISVNKLMPSRILGILRTFSILMNYALGYLIFPKRILRTLKSIFISDSASSTVLEHRLKDLINRIKA